MVGGPAIVFTRFTNVEEHVSEHMLTVEMESYVKTILGYDANALYLYCSGDVMPCGKER